MADKHCDGDWSVTTWEGSRRALLRQSLKLTVRQRLEALDELAEINNRMQGLRAQSKLHYQAQGAQKYAKK